MPRNRSLIKMVNSFWKVAAGNIMPEKGFPTPFSARKNEEKNTAKTEFLVDNPLQGE